MVDGNGNSQHYPGAGLAALRLAAQIQARYGQHVRRPPSVARDWLRLRPVVATLARHQHIHLAARLRLTVVEWPLGSGPAPRAPAFTFAAPATPAPAAPAWRPRVPTVVRTTHTVMHREAGRSERLLQPVEWYARHNHRWQPVERLTQQITQPTTAVPAGMAPPRLRPVPRVLRRPVATAATEPDGRQPALRASSSGKRSPAYGREEAPPPAVNIGDVTNQVLQQLDRRLQAHRERHGQV